MYAIVYRCRRQGVLVEQAMVKADPASGELRIRRHGFNSRIAVLLGPDGERYKLPVLTKIRVLELNDRGLLLSGYEVYPPRGTKGSGTVFPQTWWCLLREMPDFAPASVERARALVRSREASEIGRTMAAHDRRRR
ncbi:hypothetical protein [Variovorax fucosicus]|uniref:hypothetical protein n=1 Tax=Variovorax fucosicus TaxID=3053517 RepID=UPI0025791C6A|nr:hypothetical protein [Variovorax sp. J22G47]MDM0058901.1 hypothetical protein [Variovorax sp. J22G47]